MFAFGSLTYVYKPHMRLGAASRGAGVGYLHDTAPEPICIDTGDWETRIEYMSFIIKLEVVGIVIDYLARLCTVKEVEIDVNNYPVKVDEGLNENGAYLVSHHLKRVRVFQINIRNCTGKEKERKIDRWMGDGIHTLFSPTQYLSTYLL